LIERNANAAMGPSIDKIKEFDDLPVVENEGALV
jgi:glyoxylate carboligase